MPFVKGDPNINRKGRPKNAEPELLREALRREGERRNEDFWDKVASYAFTDKNVMVAVVKKFIPDMTQAEVNSTVSINNMPEITKDGEALEFSIGNADAPENP